MSYQAKPAETNIGNYNSTNSLNEGLLSKLNPTSFRGRAIGAFTAASLLAGCTSAMDVYGRNTSTTESRMVRVGQEPLELSVGRVALNLVLPVKGVVDSQVYSLYSGFKRAVDKSLCEEQDLLVAGKKALPENAAQQLYTEGCIKYSESGVGKILETLTDKQKEDLSAAVKNVLNSRISVVYLASNNELAVMPQTYVIDNVKIDDNAMISELREGLNVAGSAALWFGVAKIIGSATGSSGSSKGSGAGGPFGGGG